MDSQINKVHSPTIFSVVLSDWMGFLGRCDFPFRSDASSHTIQNYIVRRSRTPFHKIADFLDDFSVHARNADI